MLTNNQLIKFRKKKKKKKSFTYLLENCPQKKAVCTRIGWLAPKKPNSARRKVVWVTLLLTGISTLCGVPGESSKLQQYGNVLVRGGRTQDVPGLKYKIIRGKFDSNSVPWRSNGRSKVGSLAWRGSKIIKRKVGKNKKV